MKVHVKIKRNILSRYSGATDLVDKIGTIETDYDPNAWDIEKYGWDIDSYDWSNVPPNLARDPYVWVRVEGTMHCIPLRCLDNVACTEEEKTEYKINEGK